jgi:hypothetical protein
MKCSDARFLLAADPRSGDPALLEHLEGCLSCAAYAADMHEIDRRLQGALAVEVPHLPLPSGPYGVAAGVTPGAAARRRRRYATPLALAAGVAGIAVVAGMLLIGVPQPSLAGAVVAHMAHEPDSWMASSPVATDDIQRIISRSGIRLDAQLPDVTYANSCWFRGHFVPHLVVRTPQGPVTVLVLPSEPVGSPESFSEGDYRGVLVPAQQGSIAVIARSGGDVDDVASAALAAISYVD